MLDNLLEPSQEVTESNAEELETEQPEVTDEDEAAENIGEELDEAEEESEEEGDTFIIDGKEYTAERIAELESGELRQSDYTKKTQALAAERKQVGELVTQLTDVIAEFESSIDSDEAELAQLLEDGDTSEYLLRQRQIADKQKKVKNAKAAKTKANADLQAQEGKILFQSMKAWHDPKTGAAQQKADVDAAMKYAESIGHTNETLSQITDHRMIRALIDAGKNKQQASLKPKKKPAKKVVSRKSPGQKKPKSIVELFYGSK
jgi:hypothetical protein